jgi:hypothetical protein
MTLSFLIPASIITVQRCLKYRRKGAPPIFLVGTIPVAAVDHIYYPYKKIMSCVMHNFRAKQNCRQTNVQYFGSCMNGLMIAQLHERINIHSIISGKIWLVLRPLAAAHGSTTPIVIEHCRFAYCSGKTQQQRQIALCYKNCHRPLHLRVRILIITTTVFRHDEDGANENCCEND